MEFKIPTLEDKEAIDRCLKNDSTRSCDFNTSNIILWNEFYKGTYTIIDQLFILKSEDGETTFSYPMGKGDKKKAVETLMEYCRQNDIPFAMHGITKEMEAELMEMFGDIFVFEYDRDEADYVYERERLADLRGKKYHGKRNHINRFKENHDWSYEKLTDDNLGEAIEMLTEWRNQTCKPEDHERLEEVCIAQRSLTHYKEFGLTGGLLRADGRVVGLTAGEPALNPDTFVVHTEKAFPDVQGAYPMINQQFVLNEMEGYRYVNREEDMGEEGLRKAKMSYKPAFMLEKSFLHLK